MDILVEYLAELAVLGGGTLLSITMYALRKSIEANLIKLWGATGKKIVNKFSLHKLSKDRVVTSMAIHDLCTILRAKTNAARCHVCLFSNGEVFSDTTPAFKVSQVFESLASGISSTLKHSQNIRVSALLQIISPLFGNNVGNSVVHAHTKCTCNSKSNCKHPHGVYILTVEDLAPGFLKEKLTNDGVVKFVYSPLLDKKNSIIGYTSINTIDEHQILTNEELTEVCKISQQISYQLIKENK